MAKPEKTEKSVLNDRFRRLMIVARKLRNLTQREVSARIGQAQSYLGKFETGKRNLNVAEFIELARAIGVDPRRIIAKLTKKKPEIHRDSQQDETPE